MTQARTLLLLTLTLAVASLVPATRAAAPNAPTLIDAELANQLNSGGSISSSTTGAGTTTFSLTADTQYVAVSGASTSVNDVWEIRASNNTRLFQVVENGTIIERDFTNPVVLFWQNSSGSFVTGVKFRLPPEPAWTGTYTFSASGAGVNLANRFPAGVTRAQDLLGYLANSSAPSTPQTPLLLIFKAEMPLVAENGILYADQAWGAAGFFNCQDAGLTTPPALSTFYFNVTPQNVGGAYYLFLQTFDNTTSGVGIDSLIRISSSSGGAAIKVDTPFATGTMGAGGWRITVWRVWYLGVPYTGTASLTVLVDAGNPNFGTSSVKPCGLQAQNEPHPTWGRLNSHNALFNLTEILSTDDYFSAVNLTVAECVGNLTGQGACSSAGANLSNVTVVAYLAGRTVAVVSGSGGAANLSGQDLAVATFAITLSKPLYVTQTYAVTASAGYSNLTVYIKKQASAATATTSAVQCQPPAQTVAVPNRANVSFTLVDTQQAAYYTYLRIAPTGQPQTITQTLALQGPADFLLYPLGRLSTSTGALNDTGQYVLAFTDSRAALLASCTFAINSNQTAYSPPSVDGNMAGAIEVLLGTPVAHAVSSGSAPTQDQQVQDFVKQTAIFAFATWLLMPNLYWFLVTCMAVGLLMAAAVARGRR